MGRQPGCNVWVFGPDLQLKEDGSVTNPDETGVLWVQQVFALQEGKKNKSIDQTLPVVRLPLYSYSIRDVVKSLMDTIHDNYMAGIFSIGMSEYKRLF